MTFMKNFCLFACLCLLTAGCAVQRQQPSFIYGLAGTYTGGGSHGIYLFRFDPATGKAALADSIAAPNPSYLTVSADRKHFYAVHENGRPGGGAVASYSFDRERVKLVAGNRQPSGGDHPCYIAVSQDGQQLFAANYSSGTVSSFPVAEGNIGAALQVIRHQGKSVHGRQEGPHVHATVPAPDGKYLLVPDLGTDTVKLYRISRAGLTEAPAVAVRPGSGPRHLRFHPNGRWAYLVNELSGTVVFYRYGEGKLEAVQEISTLPPGYAGTFTSADIRIHPSGKFLYVSNRDALNALAIFSIGDEGMLTPKGGVSLPGKTPRHINFDPSGKFLLVAHQNGGGIAIFTIHESDGSLRDTGHRLYIDKPVCIDWL